MTTAHFISAVLIALINAFPAWLSASDNAADTDNGDQVPPTYYGNDRLDAKAVGITGGVIGGAEAVMAVQAAFGVDKWWMYVVFPVLGAGAGGVGGYYLEKASAPGAIALLVTAVAAIIPTAILTTSALAYDPDKAGAVKADTMEDKPYSFETPPEDMEVSTDESEETKTEVEAAPEVGPPEQPPPEQLEPDVSPSEPAAPEPVTPGNDDKPTSNLSKNKKPLIAAEPASGTLLHVHRDGAVSLSVPYVDIYPADSKTDTLRSDGSFFRRSDIEIRIPLVRVDLP
jgi:hypothetical protein